MKVLAWISLRSEPEGVIVKNIATDRASQEENANELQLIVLANNMMQTDYNWYC